MSLTMHLVLVPTVQALEKPYPADREPPKTHKLPEAIAKWKREDQAKWEKDRVSLCLTSPRESRVAFAGLADGRGGRTILRAPTEGDEPALLRAVWERIAAEGGDIATWNGAAQCLALVARSALHGLEPTVGASTVRDWFRLGSATHADVRQWLTDERRSGESLTNWADAFNLPHRPADLDAEALVKHFQDGRYDVIEDAVGADLDAIHAMAQRLEVFRASTVWQSRNAAEAERTRTALAESAGPVESADAPRVHAASAAPPASATTIGELLRVTPAPLTGASDGAEAVGV
ncbi:MAG: hypothetical protein H3C62_00250 [Gemmatimonadaceae bacterium]|nr:hypothetical protein [Gemmatimonadaceae bacterium]